MYFWLHSQVAFSNVVIFWRSQQNYRILLHSNMLLGKTKRSICLLYYKQTMKPLLYLFLLLFLTSKLSAQEDLSNDIAAVVFLDSFVVTATQKGFDVKDFIEIVQQDESFYHAFHNLRFLPYESDNTIQVFNKKGRVKASYQNRVQQNIEDNCRTMDFLKEQTVGNFYKNNKHNYYTARMHDQVFLSRKRICETPSKRPPVVSTQNLSGIQKHINELKKLIFQPGRAVDVPLVGKKTAIFDKDMIHYYNFSISSQLINDQWDCYVFTAIVKPEYQQRKTGKTIIKFLETYFEKNTFQVVGRNYHLKYDGLFDFDVKMEVDLTIVDDKYVPVKIRYDGEWKIPMMSKEDVVFDVGFRY